MKSLKNGKNTSVSVENITSFGVWLLIKSKEYYLDYQNYPYFERKSVEAIKNIRLLHDYHLYWPDLDVDLEIDNLENPEKYPLKSRMPVSSR